MGWVMGSKRNLAMPQNSGKNCGDGDMMIQYAQFICKFPQLNQTIVASSIFYVCEL